MNELMIFNSSEFGKIRTLEEDGKVLFCGNDIAKALGYGNPRKALNDHCPHVTKRDIGVETGRKADGSPAIQIVPMSFIPESDVYRLITHSKLESAQRFEAWVFEEVLPTIRKTGSYQLVPQKQFDDARRMELMSKIQYIIDLEKSRLNHEKKDASYWRSVLRKKQDAMKTRRKYIEAFERAAAQLARYPQMEFPELGENVEEAYQKEKEIETQSLDVDDIWDVMWP